jgi:hypothetical protein
MLDDPRINFAISLRDRAAGINHLGMQVDSTEELAEMQARLSALRTKVVEQADASCCYAKSDKYWVEDPTGIAWEIFHTLDSIPVYGEEAGSGERPDQASRCCVPAIQPAASACGTKSNCC